tara:strand:+ start:164 stop:337 length:174 start_codon:yes stop_codon:yes gene_type:complete
MITNVIVFASIFLALAYFIVWLLRSDFREQIERPKHHFQDQLNEYDNHCVEDKINNK